MTRRPQAFSPDDVQVEIMATPVEETVAAEDAPPPAPPPRRQGIFGLLMAALGGLVTLTLGLWATDLVGAAFARFAALGWLALALTVLAALAAVVLLGREWLALRRLQRVETVRLAAETALAERSDRLAAEAATKLDALLAANPQAARGRAAYARAVAGGIVDGRDKLRILEREALEPLDRAATKLIAETARRVSVTTALSPRALLDIAIVVWSAFRLVRRLAELYGGRPGTLAQWRLMRQVLVLTLVSGGMAAGDEVVSQLLGQGLAARLSARLGEGVVNGLLTARLGLAALLLTRPLPFIGAPKPDIRDFASDLFGRR
jgi:putative membrane protein